MNAHIPETARMEIKFVAYEGQYQTLLRWLRLHSAGFIEPFPERWVNNVYFDTYNYTAFTENLSGASSRKKVRYRWYGESMGPGAGALEVKCKRSHFSWKLVYNVPKGPYKSLTTWHTLRRELRGYLPPDGKIWLDSSPFPVLINRYYRKYFLSSDGKIRVTVDTKLAVWDQRFKCHLNLRNRANLAHILVVEFKFDPKDRGIAAQIVQNIPLRVSRHSKYVNGVRAISER